MIRIVGYDSGEHDADLHKRLVGCDPGLWGLTPETPELLDRLGWLTAPTDIVARLDSLESRVEAISTGSVVLLGMGGSSLAPAVIGDVSGRSRVS